MGWIGWNQQSKFFVYGILNIFLEVVILLDLFITRRMRETTMK